MFTKSNLKTLPKDANIDRLLEFRPFTLPTGEEVIEVNRYRIGDMIVVYSIPFAPPQSWRVCAITPSGGVFVTRNGKVKELDYRDQGA